MKKIPDSLIFDMDGTLWDAADTYLASWNHILKEQKIDIKIDRRQFVSMMGWETRKVLDFLLPDFEDQRQFEIYQKILELRIRLIAEMGGSLYGGVREGLIALSKEYQLFIVSNCPKDFIAHFISWADIGDLITDEMAHGMNDQPKHFNIQLLIDKHGLKSPVYIGDTETDSLESHKAGIPFVFMSYGFGSAERYEYRFDDFISFTEHFLQLKNRSELLDV